MRYSTSIIRWRRVSFSSCPPTSVTKTRKKSARRRSSPSCETWHHFKARVLSKRGYCAWPRTRRWIFAEKVAPRNGAATLSSSRSMATAQGAPIDPPSRRPGPDAVLINAETSRLIRQSLDQLGDPCREIIELRYYGELSYDEIAAELRSESENGQLALKQVSRSPRRHRKKNFSTRTFIYRLT